MNCQCVRSRVSLAHRIMVCISPHAPSKHCARFCAEEFPSRVLRDFGVGRISFPHMVGFVQTPVLSHMESLPHVPGCLFAYFIFRTCAAAACASFCPAARPQRLGRRGPAPADRSEGVVLVDRGSRLRAVALQLRLHVFDEPPPRPVFS